MNKIDFMAGLPAAFDQQRGAGSIGLEIGQTWRNTEGREVTVYREWGFDGSFIVKREFGFGDEYRVRADGTSADHGSILFDLVERVQRVYIAGPMTGYVDLNFPAFNAAAAEYRRRGCFVINPAEICGGADELDAVAKMAAEQKEEHWRNCMVKDINALLTCEMIVMLDGWTRSKGANLEHHIARSLGMTIAYPVDTYRGEVQA